MMRFVYVHLFDSKKASAIWSMFNLRSLPKPLGSQQFLPLDKEGMPSMSVTHGSQQSGKRCISMTTMGCVAAHKLQI